MLNPCCSFFGSLEHWGAKNVAFPEAYHQAPAASDFRRMMFAVEADKDSHELIIRKDETALAVLVVNEHTY